jgi:hypothetical protein
MGKYSEVFVAFDVAKKKHAMAIAEGDDWHCPDPSACNRIGGLVMRKTGSRSLAVS